MNDDQTQDVTTPLAQVDSPEEANIPETSETPVSDVSSLPNGSKPADTPPEAPESPQDISTTVPIESQNPPINQLESEVPEPSNGSGISQPDQIQPQSVSSQPVSTALAPQTPLAPQAQSPAQQDQTGFIRALLAKAQAEI